MMSGFATAAVVAVLVASPALPQSADPHIGSGNFDPSPSSFEPQSPAARRGWIFVRVNCAQCHAIDRVSASPVASATPLRNLRIKYAVADLQRPLAEGIHSTMPVLRLTAGQVADIMAYLKALQDAAPYM
jgi:cytochrome c